MNSGAASRMTFWRSPDLTRSSFQRKATVSASALTRRAFEIAEEGQLSSAVQIHQPVPKQAPEQPRQPPHMQKDPRFAGDPPGAAGRQAAAWHDHVDVRMVG